MYNRTNHTSINIRAFLHLFLCLRKSFSHILDIIQFRRTNEMNQESCCTCARLLVQIERNEGRNGLPSYSASTLESNSSIQSTRSDASLGGKTKEETVFSEKGPACDIEKERGDTHWNEKERSNSRENRRLSCCGRIICGECIEGNERFGSYCPFCQVRSAETMDNTVAASTPSRSERVV